MYVYINLACKSWLEVLRILCQGSFNLELSPLLQHPEQVCIMCSNKSIVH